MLHPLLRAAVGCAVALTAAVPAVAADPVVWRTDYASARKEAEEKKLPLLVVVGTEQCVYCRKQEVTTFVDKDVMTLLAGRAVLLKVDANRDGEFARAMRVSIYPTTVIAGTDGKVFAYLAGYQSPEQFREHAGKAFDLIAAAEKPKDRLKPGGEAVLTARVKPEPKIEMVPAEAVKHELATARASFKAERYAEALDQAEAIAATYPNTPAGEEALGILATIKADPLKLSRAGEQLDDKYAAAYLAIAEGLEQKGKTREAVGYYEKVLMIAPASKVAERARAKMAVVGRGQADGRPNK
jgi:tetratricopeptide (TPR) repeat protein